MTHNPLPSLYTITLGDPFSINVTALGQCFAHLEELFSLNNIQGVIIGHHGLYCAQLQEAAKQGLVSSVLCNKLTSLPCIHVLADDSKNMADVFADKLVTIHSPWCFLHSGPDLSGLPHTTQLSVKQRGAVSLKALEALRYISDYADQHHLSLSVITSPIDKFASQTAGFLYSGHTEYFTDLWQGHKSAIMVLYGERLKVGLLTHHLPLREVSDALSVDLIQQKTLAFVRTLRHLAQLDGSPPLRPIRIALCGVNPHLSDGGLWGNEEEDIFIPALCGLKKEQQQLGFIVDLVAADSAFYHAYHQRYHGVLAAYHDQGLGPIKTVHFDSAVNITGGLRHFRLSPDHGPACDLYMSSQASFRSFLACSKLALCYHKTFHHD
ncbi:MAG: 4-hydroxythreonine-4-phosphate dehydrogenase PdxA [Proteobacteria bacterium]|nr:4-hydroxythreonine-4-phosphate dehydrogenase PdxA [Pseudomonadota bacterium]